MPDRTNHETARAGFLLLLVLLAFYGPTILSEHFLFAGVIQDITNLYGFYPWDEFTSQELGRGHFPLWNPYNGLGLPHLANMQSAPFYPLQWLKYLLGFWVAADLVLLLRLWLAGFFTFLFSRRALGLTEPGALSAALAFMLCGYFTRYVYMSHLNVETLLPLALWLFHRLAQKPVFRRGLGAGAAVFLLFAGGFPEAALYCLGLAVAYYLFETLRQKSLRRALPPLAFSLALGLFFSAGQWLPFAEYLGHAWTYHDPTAGLRHRDAAYAISLILPWFFGDNALSTLVPFLVPAVGLIPFGLALRAALSLPRLSPRALFFFAVGLVSAGIAYGLPPFDRLGFLYPFSVTYNDKYSAPVLALAVALLAGQGLDLVRREPEPRLSLRAGALILGWVVANVGMALLNGFAPFFGFGAQAGMIQAAGLLSAAALTLALTRKGLLSAPMLSWGFVLILTWNLFLDFRGHRPVFEEDKIFRLPAINFLDHRAPYRVVAEDELLFPNLLLPQRIADLRAYDPLYPLTYVRFMAVLNRLSPDEVRQHYDRHMLFQVEPDRWNSPLLDIANVVWVVLAQEPGATPLAERMLTEGIEIGPFAGWARHLPVSLGLAPRRALVHHAPDLLEAGLDPAPGQTLRFLVGVPQPQESNSDSLPPTASRPGVWAGMTLGPGCRPLYWRYLDPLREHARGRWLKAETEPLFGLEPLSRLRLLALPGPHGPAEQNLLAWSGLRMYQPQGTPPGFEPASPEFDAVVLYLNHHAQKRAFLVFGSSLLPGDTPGEQFRHFAQLAEQVPELFSQQVFLSRPIDFPWPKTAVENLHPPAPRVVFSEYTPDRVRLSCGTPRPAFLVLADQYFPGWKARVREKEIQIAPGHLALRTVPVPAGESEIIFFYQPWSFRIGLWLMLASAAFCLGAVLAGGRGKTFFPCSLAEKPTPTLN